MRLIPEENREEARRLIRTGEEIAVIVARISRTSGTFDTIASEVDEEGASKFHQKWTVSVEGYGHKSVGEHDIATMAVENVSSEQGDQFTDNRLGSYTEFSARFKGRQGLEYFVPFSVANDEDLYLQWHRAHEKLFETSDVLTARGREWVFTQEAQNTFPQLQRGYYNPKETEAGWKARLGKHAADQFKNLLPASRLTSMGVTWNATEAENAIRKLLSSPSRQTRELGKKYKEARLKVSPTLVKYADFNPYLASVNLRRANLIEEFGLEEEYPQIDEQHICPDINISTDIEAIILSAFAYESGSTGKYASLLKRISSFDTETRSRMFSKILGEAVTWEDFEHHTVTSAGLGSHDMPPRAFEFDGGYIYEFPNMTYGDWRDYKRHRIQSYIAKPLSPQWGYMIPPLAYLLDQSENQNFHGSVDILTEAVEGMDNLFKVVAKVDPIDAQLAVTRLHYRPAIARFNMREAFHLLKLRTGNTAHPFIRRIMWPTYDELMQRHPGMMRYLKIRGERTQTAFP